MIVKQMVKNSDERRIKICDNCQHRELVTKFNLCPDCDWFNLKELEERNLSEGVC